jgi:hypothetical protein
LALRWTVVAKRCRRMMSEPALTSVLPAVGTVLLLRLRKTWKLSTLPTVPVVPALRKMPFFVEGFAFGVSTVLPVTV